MGALFCCSLFATAADAAAAGYGLKVVAQSGQSGIISIGQNVSINNNGFVAFTATTANGISGFVGNGDSPPKSVTPPPTADGVYACIQINNVGQVVVERGPFSLYTDPVSYYGITISPGFADSYGFLQLFDANGSAGSQTVAAFDFRVLDSGVSGIGTIAQGPFSYIGPAFSLNNNGGAVFIADTSTGLNPSYVMATPGPGQTYNTTPMWIGAQPMIADNGQIVVRNGQNQTDPIVLYPSNLSSPTSVASLAAGFTSLGSAPGISDDGQYVAFYGELSPTGAAKFQTTPGPGIFLSTISGPVVSIRRIAGLSNKNGTVVTSFDASGRVGIAAKANEPQSPLVVFTASDSSGNKGIFTGGIAAVTDLAVGPDALAVKGTTIASGVVQDVCLYDPINAEGQIAFWVSTSAGRAVVMAIPEGTLSVTGQVTAADDGSPLAGATVTIGGSSTATGSDGSYSLTKLLPGTFSITASQPGYAPRTDSVTLSASTPVLTHNFALYPLPVVTAAQRAGTSLVDVNYVLRLAPGDSAQVSLAFSGNGGASFDFVPATGALQGDAGSGIASGSHAVTWNAANTVPASSYFPNCVAQVTAVVGGTTIAGVSPSFALDLRLNATVSGRVLDGVDLHPIADATVSLDGKQVTTAVDGSYSFAPMPVSSGDLIAVSATGYAPATVALQVPQGAVSVCVPDILLSPEHQAPEVTDVASTFEPVYLAGISMPDDFTASVDWNGSTPGVVSFYVNDRLFQTAAGPGPIYTVMIDSGAFDPSFVVGANTVKVVAQSVEGQTSDPFDVDVLDIPTPAQLFQVFTAIGSQVLPAPVQSISAQAPWPTPPLTTPMWTLPVLGTFGLKFYLNPELSFDRESFEWELKVGNAPDPEDRPGGTDDKSLTLYLGDKVIAGDITVSGTGTVSPTDGFAHTTVSLGASLSDKLDLGPIGLPRFLGPVISGISEKVPVVGKLVKAVSIELYAEPELHGQLLWDFPSFQFDSATFGGSSPFYAEYNPKLGKLGELKVDVGTKTDLEFQLPPVPPDGIIKSIEIEGYASAEWKIWVFKFSGEFVWLSFTYPPKPGKNLVQPGTGFSGWVPLRIVAADGMPTAARPNLPSGPEGFVANGSLQRAGVPDDVQSVGAALQAFRAIGQRRTPHPGQPRPQDGSRGDLVQADLTLVTNSLPDCQPTLDARGQELMLLYVGDNGSTNILQSTDIRWTHYDGTNWSAPLTIETNTRAEFNPQVKYDGSGDAVAVWERVADPNFTTADLTVMARQMEIAWSKWSRASGQWSVPQTLATNSYLDHQPLLAGPMADRSLLLTWTRNTANLLMGTNGAGSDVLWSQWSPAAQTWTPPQALVTNLAYCLSQSLAGASNQGLFVWSQDTGGTLTNTPDDQVFVCTWTNRAWSSAQQLTTGGAGNRNARVALSPGGALALVWQQGADLVVSTNLSSPPALARANSQTAGFEDFALTCGPGGNFCLLWQEMTTNGSHAHYAVYDPSATAWRQDALLRNDPPMESAFAPAWDDAGNLTVAYELVNMLTTNVTATVTNGDTVTIPNVPLQGRVDLAVTKRPLIKDLALLAGDFTVQGNNYLPGDVLTLSANVRNTGDLAVSNVLVGFYDGDPNAGGVLITNVVIPGWLPGAASNLAVAQWVVPSPPTNYTLYAVVNFGTTSSEFNPTNNTQSVSVGGTDLAVSLVSYTPSTNGALRVIAAVQNLGAPAATNSVLAISFDGQTNAFLATAAVPALDLGRLAQVVLNMPPGTQPPGEATYRLFANATGVVPDVNPANETVTFSVFLWIDSDGDGIPDWWMINYFGHPTGLASDHSRAQDDFDGDGMTNFAEYLAGTDPTDPKSDLRIQAVTPDPSAGVQVTWSSVSNHIYSLQRTGDLTLPFTNVVQHILATPPQNALFDPTATNGAPLFYRIKLE